MPRRPDPIEPKETPHRQLPHSLSRVFRIVRNRKGEANAADFCDALRQAYAKDPCGWHTVRELPQGAKVLQTTEQGGPGPLMFNQIKAYALTEEVPSGVLLMVSHLISKFEHEADNGQPRVRGNQDEAFRAAAGMQAMLDCFAAMFPIDQVRDDEVHSLLNAYHEGVDAYDRGPRRV